MLEREDGNDFSVECDTKGDRAMTFEEYLKKNVEAGAIDHCLRATMREVTVLSQVVQGIATYSSDTLSGRTDGPEDREWFRDGFEEILRRCQEALDQHR